MTGIRGALFPMRCGAVRNVPARDHRIDFADSGDADFLFIDGAANALQPFDVRWRVEPMRGCGLVGDHQPLTFVHSQRKDRYAKHSCDCSDGVYRGVGVSRGMEFVSHS